MRYLLIIFLFLGHHLLFSQQDSSRHQMAISGYAEAYYLYDFSNPVQHNRPDFVYAFNRHNEVNLNLGYLKAAYATAGARANMALMAGTYANANLAAEPGVLRNVMEANLGVKLSKKKNLWLDAGILPSHIGFESAVGRDCWNLTRSMMADNSPYFETGVKVGYTSNNGKWFISGLLLNGWQRIQRPAGNNTPAFGHQITWKPNASVTLNSSSFVGNDKLDVNRQMRLFHNFYGIFQANSKMAFTVGFDMGTEQIAKNSNEYNTWLTPIAMAKFAVSPKMALALRGEYFRDVNGVIIATGTRDGFQTLGYSANLDYAIQDNVLWRVEAKGLTSKNAIFLFEGENTRNNFLLAMSLSIAFR